MAVKLTVQIFALKNKSELSYRYFSLEVGTQLQISDKSRFFYHISNRKKEHQILTFAQTGSICYRRFADVKKTTKSCLLKKKKCISTYYVLCAVLNNIMSAILLIISIMGKHRGILSFVIYSQPTSSFILFFFLLVHLKSL